MDNYGTSGMKNVGVSVESVPVGNLNFSVLEQRAVSESCWPD